MTEDNWPNTNPNPKNAYEVQKALSIWEDFEKYNGSNYVSEQYVSKYRNMLSDLEGKQRGGLTRQDIKDAKFVVDEEGWLEELQKKIRRIKNKKMRGTADWKDDLLYDVYVDMYRERR
jgi:N-acetylneuraminic acid mutarotase